MENNITLGSLFDSIGGFSLGELISGLVYYALNAVER